MTARLKDGELGKHSFQRSQGLGGAEGALWSGRRMSPVGQVCLSPRAGPGKSPSEGSGPPASVCCSGGNRWGVETLLLSGSERQQGECGPDRTQGQGQPGWTALRRQEARLGGGCGRLEWAGRTRAPLRA